MSIIGRKRDTSANRLYRSGVMWTRGVRVILIIQINKDSSALARCEVNMTSTFSRAASFRHASTNLPSRISHSLQRAKSTSTSPYGKSHRQRLPALPRPTVALFPQLVVMTNGSTYTHWSTSPRSVVRLTRDVNNNPLWRPGSEGEDQLEDETGRLGRFKRRFEDADDVVDFSTFDETPAPRKSEKAK